MLVHFITVAFMCAASVYQYIQPEPCSEHSGWQGCGNRSDMTVIFQHTSCTRRGFPAKYAYSLHRSSRLPLVERKWRIFVENDDFQRNRRKDSAARARVFDSEHLIARFDFARECERCFDVASLPHKLFRKFE